MISSETLLAICKFTNLALCGLLIILAFIRYGTESIGVKEAIWTFYWILFATIMILAEVGLKIIFKWFKFLEGYYGKGAYIIFLGSLLLQGWKYRTFIGIFFIFSGFAYICCSKKAEKNSPLPQKSVEQSQHNQQPQDQQFNPNQQNQQQIEVQSDKVQQDVQSNSNNQNNNNNGNNINIETD